MRAAEDAAHCRLLQCFSLFSCTAFRPPLTADRLAALPRLSPDLLRQDPQFENAPIAVQSNQERVVFNKFLTQRFAKRNGEPIFRWVLPMAAVDGNDI